MSMENKIKILQEWINIVAKRNKTEKNDEEEMWLKSKYTYLTFQQKKVFSLKNFCERVETDEN